MGKKAKPPKAPNYAAIAQQQADIAKQNNERDILNSRPNQVGPTGSLTWAKDPTTGAWTQTTAFNPEEQALYEAQRGNQQALSGTIGEQINALDLDRMNLQGSDLPEMPTVGGYNQQVIDALRQLQAPDLAQRRSATDARLAAMGLGTGSGTAYETAQRTVNDAESRADLNAILAGVQQGNTEFGQAMQARQQGANEAIQPLRNLQGLYGLNQNVQMPTFSSFNTPLLGNAGTPDLMGAAQAKYSADIDRANASGSGLGSTLGGIAGGIAGSFIGMPTVGAMAGSALGGAIGGDGGGGGGGYSPAGLYGDFARANRMYGTGSQAPAPVYDASPTPVAQPANYSSNINYFGSTSPQFSYGNGWSFR